MTTKKPAPKAPRDALIGVRVPPSLAKRLDALVATRTKARPHLPATRSELLREALEVLLTTTKGER